MVKIEPLGIVQRLNELGEWQSSEINVPLLNGIKCIFILEDFEPDNDLDIFEASINQFLSLTPSDFDKVVRFLYQYYQDILKRVGSEEINCEHIESASEVKKHIGFSNEINVTKRRKDGLVYLSIEGGCDWEEEHGLQIVFRGAELVKVGPYSGHLTNSDAYADESLEGVIYKTLV